ncbi:Hypothetical protein BSSP3_II0642 [Brucella suis bv. 2]|nr:Hypothetical protein BSSP3_II0642 [Brucella suis bv. 2]
MPASPSEARFVGHRAVPVKTESPETALTICFVAFSDAKPFHTFGLKML